MPTPSDSTGRQPPANPAAPGSSSSNGNGQPPANPLPLPARPGSTGSHRPGDLADSDFILTSGSSQRQSAESDIAHFLANPQAVVGNTDDAPTVITKSGQSAGTPQPHARPLPVVVSGDVPSVHGRRLGHFELIEAIGAGGMAAVLKARDLELGRTVALKILPPEAARDQESVNRFKQEARAAAALDHENIARVYFCGEDQGLHFIAFEFVEGINLRQMIDRLGVLPAAECVRYMMQVAAGLHHAAERGVVHRDIKPSNILVTPDGRAKIVDMGLARHLGSELVNGGVTQSGVTLGTFDYISPEQALDPRRADARSDIYSLGCTFYHALTGRPPVPEGTAARKLRAHQAEDPLDPRALNPSIPDELAAVLARMMAKDPQARYQSPMELIAHLKGLAERLKLGTDAIAYDSAVQMVPAESRLLPEPPGLRPWWVLAASAVCLAAAAFVVATSNPAPAPVLPQPEQAKKAPEPVVGERVGPPLPPAPQAGVVKTAEELAQRLEDPATTKIVLASGKFDLATLERAVVFQGKKLELVGAPVGSLDGPTRIILTASPGRDAHGSLTLRPTALTVRNVRFELKLDPEITVEDFGATQPVGLRVEDAEKVEFFDCVFAGAPGQFAEHEPRAVRVERPGGPTVKAERCVFAVASPGSVALAVPPGSTVTLTDSGFGPHAAAVRLDDPAAGDAPATEVRLTHCSFMLQPGGAAVEAGAAETGGPANVRVTASDCLFAPVPDAVVRSPFSTPEANRRGVVVRVRAEKPEGVTLAAGAGRTNGYHEVDPLGTKIATLSFEDCKSEAPGVDGKGRTELKRIPWAQTEPVAAAESASPWRAFKLKVEAPDAVDPGVFVLNDKQQVVPLGAAFHQAGNAPRAYADITSTWGAFLRPKAPAEARRRVWFPAAKLEEPLAPGVYRSLHALLDEARPGEEVLIRHTGELPLNTVELTLPTTKPGEFKLTFRAEGGSQPILTVHPDGNGDQTFFKLIGGEVTFEGIHFLLRPDQPKAGQTVAAVAMLGGKRCTFNNCVFTMAEEDDSAVAAVHLPNIPRGVMMMKPEARQAPKVAFNGCLIRGRGRGAWAEKSRSLNLEMTDTLTAIAGPVLLSEAGGEANGGSNRATLTRVTALAGGPLVEMRGPKSSDAKGGALPPLHVDADECLFVAVRDAGRPLVELGDIDPADWKSVLTWQVTKGNRYANFDASSDSVWAIIRSGDGTEKRWSRTQWADNVGEPPDAEKRFGEVKLASPVPEWKKLGAVRPADAAVKMADFPDLTGDKPLEAGADPARLANLPPLPAEPK